MQPTLEEADQQVIYRTLLQGMSHPGRVYRFTTTTDLSGATVVERISATLMDHEVGFCVLGDGLANDLAHALSHRTKAACKPLPEADFVWVLGGDSQGQVCHACRGNANYPDQGATVIYALNAGSPNEVLPITLRGPGIPPDLPLTPGLNGLSLNEWGHIREVNADYPLGIDCIVAHTDGRVMCIPRSTRIQTNL